MTKADRKAEWRLWLQWTAATGVGLVLYTLVFDSGGWDVIPAAAAWTFLGIALGTTQWLVVRRRLPGMVWWVPATAVGVTLGLLLEEGYSRLLPFPGHWWGYLESGAVVGATVGLTTGLAQGLVLQRHLSQAGWWVLASAMAWATPAIAFSALLWGSFSGGFLLNMIQGQ